MPSSFVDASSFLRFADKCIQMPRTLSGIEKAGLEGAAFETKKGILTAAAARGWPTKGKVAVRVWYRIEGHRAVVQGRGFAGMFEKGAAPHREPKERGRKRNHKINIPGLGPKGGDGVFDHIQHPGFHGRPFWDEGVAAAAPLLAKGFQTGIQIQMQKLFR